MKYFYACFAKIGFLAAFLCTVQEVSAQLPRTFNAIGTAFANAPATACNTSNCFQMTSSAAGQLGAIWDTAPLDLTQSFDIDLCVNLGTDDAGADGICFVLQNTGTNAIGVSGGAIGYDPMPNQSVAVEFDVFENPALGDIAADHVAINYNSNMAAPVAASVPCVPSAANMEDGNFHQFRLVWNAPCQTLQVYVDGFLRITHTDNIITNVFLNNPSVFWGLTSSTGGATNVQQVCVNGFTLTPPTGILGNDTTLCLSQALPLNATTPTATYLWSDGATTATNSFNGFGTYWVDITVAGCTYRDSVVVNPCPADLCARQQGNIWYFGFGAGLDFNSGSPVLLNNGQINTFEGSAVISDANGNLLFYTDGISVWNRNHIVMPNGTGLLGNPSATQAAVIVPHPGDINLYYIFTSEDASGPNGFRYSMVDMRLGGGNGAVTATKNVLLLANNTEKITAVKHCNNRDYWVITHEFGNSNYRVYAVTPNGLNTTPQTQAIGSTHAGATGNKLGYLKASSDGSRLAAAIFADGRYEVFDFDNSTGIISNPLSWADASAYNGAYGVEFSPDKRLLYTTHLSNNIIPAKVMQFDLNAGSAAAVQASRVDLASNPLRYQFGAVQIAPDGLIYIARAQRDPVAQLPFLARINNPNTQGVGANFQDQAISLAPFGCDLGLPNFIQSAFVDLTPEIVSLNNATFCSLPQTLTYTIERPNPCLTDTIIWTYTGNGSIQSQTDTSITLQFTLPGTHQLVAEVVGFCANSSDTAIIVGIPPTLTTSNDTTICLGDSTALFASGGLTYSWSPATGLSATNIANPMATPTAPITYTVTSSAPGTNLINNSDFSAGNTGFSSSYAFTTPPNTAEGQYFVGSNPQAWNGGMANCGDHTTGSGNMLLVNGATAAGVSIWCQNVPVIPNTDYVFSTFGQTVSLGNPARLQFSINGALLGSPFDLTNINCDWQQFYATWNSVAATSAAICIVNQNTLAAANDFALDDITFAPLCNVVETVVITVDTCLFITNIDTAICENSTFNYNGNILLPNSLDTFDFVASNGYDSLVIVNISQLDTFFRQIDTAICLGSTFLFAGQNLATGTNQTFVFTNAAGCDSTYIVNVTALDTFRTIIDTTICPYETVAFNGNTLQPNSVNIFTFQAANGCDSVIVINVNAAPLPTQAAIQTALQLTNISCGGGNNGQAILSLAMGAQPYTYLWDNGQLGNTATGYTAGGHGVTITDANSCTVTSGFTLTEPTPLQIASSSDSVSCRFGNDGAASTSANGGLLPYTYLWSNGRNTAINNNLVAGIYTVTATDFNSCRIVDTIEVFQPDEVVLANIIQSNNPTCNSFTNGDATVNGSGGIPNYTFVWSNGQTSVTATGLGAGSYQVTVIDQRGCTATANTNLSQPSALVATASVFSNYNGADVTCPNAADGIARVLVSGGAGGYSYVWSTVPVQNTAIANNLTAGTYQVTVSDVSGCQLVRSVTLVNPVPLAATETNIDVFCNGGNTGQIIVNATPNTGTIGINGYEYAIFGPNQVGNVFSGNNSFFGLSVGTYTIVVRDGNNCTLPVSVAITEPTVLALAVSNTAVTCFGTATGTATAVATGGVAPYTFRWSNGQSTAMATALAAGGYAVTATDANGCDRVQQTIITEPTVLQATVATQGVSCNGGNNGTATVTAQGGTAPYTFRWSNSQTAQTANALIAGAANVTVTDANNCQTIINFTITEPLGLTASVSPQAVTCGGGSNGQATANPLGGTAPYTYLWVNGQTAQTATGLTAGTYSVVVSDANGCQTNATTTINQPSALNILVSSFTDTRCSNSTDGTATAQASGGTAPYRFAWSNGQTTLTATGLAANTNYNVTVTDANGCQNQTLISVGSPTAIQLNNFTIVDVTCRGGNNGRAGTFATGGTPPYSFRWSNNQTTATATGLIAGLYSLTVTDANGCATSGQATISQPTQSLSMFLNSTPSLCAGEPSGQVVAVPGGGTPLAGNTYVYQWSNGATTRILSGVTAGNYSVTVTDANGCSLSQSAMVGNGGGVQIQAQVLQNITCGGGSNGRANAVASTTNGGSASLIWSTGATTNNISGLSAGTYTVSATDANGCTAVDTIVINDGLQVAATAAIQSVSCFGLADGAINVTASPVGVLYEWSNAFVSNDGNISGLTAGVYTVTVTVALGCTQSFTYNLGEPTELNTSISTTANVLCFGGTEGALTAVANGGTAPYTYLWNDGNTNSLRDTLTAGGYTLIVTDANGCSVTNTALLEEPAALVLTSESTGTTCSDSEDGQIAVSAEGGTANLGLYEFSTDGENWQTGNLFPNLAANAYTVFVRDANNCMDSAIINIDAADPFFIITTTADTSIIFGDTLTLAVTMNDTTGALLVWSQLGAGGSVLDTNVLSIIVTPSDATQYQFVATNSNGCQVDTTILVEVDKPRDANAPKGFTPNGDGINDQFFIQGDGSKITAVRALRVYDRWGELVFDGADMTVNDATQGWDGTFRGKNVSSGIFAWYAEIEFIDGFVLVLKGDITLLR
jgi:gliding motility-associated-like protein